MAAPESVLDTAACGSRRGLAPLTALPPSLAASVADRAVTRNLIGYSRLTPRAEGGRKMALPPCLAACVPERKKRSGRDDDGMSGSEYNTPPGSMERPHLDESILRDRLRRPAAQSGCAEWHSMREIRP